jgi:hypothetical protein
MSRLPISVLFALVLALGSSASLEAGGCPAPVPVANSSLAGGFDLDGTSFASKPSPGPEIRFWAFGRHGQYNSGSQRQFYAKDGWLVNPAQELEAKGFPATHFALFQANWMGPDVGGCIAELPLEERRTVVEISFADPGREGTTGHQGFYAAASVPFDAKVSGFDFDKVRGASGADGNVVKVAPVPAPKVLQVAPAAEGQVSVEVELPGVPSYSEGGQDKPVQLVKGYRLLLARGDEPTSSDPSKYAALGGGKTLAPGKATVTVPGPAEGLWLVTQVVYNDPAEVLSRATSAHVKAMAGAAATGSGGRGRGDDKRQR